MQIIDLKQIQQCCWTWFNNTAQDGSGKGRKPKT
jgi:hypothetical protein